MQPEYNCDTCDHLYRRAAQKGRPVNPLAHGVQGGGYQKGITARYAQFPDVAIGSNNPVQFHGPGDTRHLCKLRVNRIHPVD